MLRRGDGTYPVSADVLFSENMLLDWVAIDVNGPFGRAEGRLFRSSCSLNPEEDGFICGSVVLGAG